MQMSSRSSVGALQADGSVGDETGGSETSIAEWLRLIRSEYLEIPGLNLNRSQVQRLWGLDATTCNALLQALVDVRFLRRTHAGLYVRADGGGR
jgi:hypothetical protein